MNNTLNITGSTVTVAEKIDVINQIINSTQPSLEDLLKLIAAIKSETAALPEEVQAKVQDELDEAEQQIKKDPIKALSILKNAETMLAQLPKTAAAAVTVGNMLSQAAIYCAKLFGL
ncbi:MAG: hypothetical protein D3920_14710 [Candidatus Electrothrix sp. AW2]|nr:hypothetical protein [Candidatus Electrothrix gigas]